MSEWVHSKSADGGDVYRKSPEPQIQLTNCSFNSRMSEIVRAVKGAGYRTGVITVDRDGEISARQDMSWADDGEKQIGTWKM